jgi:hypothetical protein
MITPPHVYISYSHRDKRFADELMVHLAPLRQRFAFNLWFEERITPGVSWKQEIDAVLGNTNIAILLVSANYLASDWLSQTAGK